MSKKSAKFKIGLLCGGPSLERGISLNSARSLMDHLESEDIDIEVVYFDTKKRPFHVSRSQLYSNTPSDFDFKLKQTARSLNTETLLDLLRTTDIVFPVMHGSFGEDGEIQNFLEKHKIPFVGSGSASCKKAFDKFNSNEYIRKNNFFTFPSIVLKIYHSDHRKKIEDFFKENKIQRAIVKPASGGSSIGVFSVSSVEEALEKVNLLFSKRMDTRVVIEPFAEGREFTVILLENSFGIPVALPPTEIETDYTENQIFDFRKKYLPTRQVIWHCPPRFEKAIIDKIQAQAEHLFSLFQMHDFARFDGWVLPDGNIWFCDFNPISGMEQNSFLFQQASRVGMTHSDVLQYIVKRASSRFSIKFPEIKKNEKEKRKDVNIIMGGNNSEKQVSLISGTNVWLKLRNSKIYNPKPYLLDIKGQVWRLPYQLCLNHTVEEIKDNCENYHSNEIKIAEFENRARLRLGFLDSKNVDEFFEPKKMTLKEFFDNSEFVFIALHGGDGENGNFQKIFETKGIKFNGPSEKVSRLCMDKKDTSVFIDSLKIEGVNSIPSSVVNFEMMNKFKDSDFRLFWRKIRKDLNAHTVIVKPRADGCTTGVVHLHSSQDLKKYIRFLADKVSFIPKQTFKGQFDIIEMPSLPLHDILFEKFIETDVLRVKADKLKYQYKTGWVEITVGVIEEGKKIKSMNPSITVVEGEVLTVEEKFQGGTGVNITPPPLKIMKPNILEKVKNKITELSRKISIEGYSRIDAFVNLKSGDLQIIEINTLPGLTPSTVFYHQGLAESQPIFPRNLIELLIKNKDY